MVDGCPGSDCDINICILYHYIRHLNDGYIIFMSTSSSGCPLSSAFGYCRLADLMLGELAFMYSNVVNELLDIQIEKKSYL